MKTPLLSVPLIQESQAGKYFTHNEAVALIEAIVTRVLSRTNGAPPSSPSEGDTYIVDSATGDWSDASVNDIAHYFSGRWVFVSPVEGLSIWVVDEAASVYYDGLAWALDFASRLNFNVTLANNDAVGVVDRLPVSSNVVGFGAAFRINSSGNLVEANATDPSTMPCMALALETGTNVDTQVLFWGRVRKDSWSWTSGGYIYIDTSDGLLTQSRPTNTGNIVQTVGIALSENVIFFNPSYVTVELA